MPEPEHGLTAGRGKRGGGAYNQPHEAEQLNRIAFPLGGIGAGMICVEGTGAFSHVSVRNRPQVFNEPALFAALSVEGPEPLARVVEGPVPDWKVFGRPGSGNGAAGSTYGLPRYASCSFSARFPFAELTLTDPHLPIDVVLTAWSPFIPGEADRSSLPVASLEYKFKNRSEDRLTAAFSFHSRNFMSMGSQGASIGPIEGGFVLRQAALPDRPEAAGAFAVAMLGGDVEVDHCWFRGGWWDPLTVTWRHIERADPRERVPETEPCAGATAASKFSLDPGEERTIQVLFAWYVPDTDLRWAGFGGCSGDECTRYGSYRPWYAGQFGDVEDVLEAWRRNYEALRSESLAFRDALFDMTLPAEVVEAVSANLSILKSPTLLRQTDGRLWCWEGCSDDNGCCHGSCTHVWNYAQAIPHLFPDLERTLRETEFFESQDERGHQSFRSGLPIHPVDHTFHAAADGQLGGIMKVYREWRISADTEWLRRLWPRVRSSLDYCIATWDPRETGTLEEPHHNTYDIEFWGPDGMCTSFYLGALAAAEAMGTHLGDPVERYTALLEKGRTALEGELFDGEYFVQNVRTTGLNSPDPVAASQGSWSSEYSPEAIELLRAEGPKYQYGTGCLSDGILGSWIARMCGLDEIADRKKVESHLLAVHRHNLRHTLAEHANPQRPSFALGDEGGLLLCTWPKGGKPTLPFVYSDEVWTGIEYQVASHLMLHGHFQEGLEIVRTCRDRYDGVVRNPFSEIECGHWYARALASYGLLQGMTGVRYDAVDRTLYLDARAGTDYRVFLSTATGFGTVGLSGGEPLVALRKGRLDVQRVIIDGNETAWEARQFSA